MTRMRKVSGRARIYTTPSTQGSMRLSRKPVSGGGISAWTPGGGHFRVGKVSKKNKEPTTPRQRRAVADKRRLGRLPLGR